MQGNIAQSLKFDPGRYASDARYLPAAGRWARDARLIVLPETAIPRFLDTIDARYLEELARACAVDTGRHSAWRADRSSAAARYYNSVVTLGSSPPQSYAKSHLVPLGEFVPPEFGWIVRVLRIPLSDFSRGTDHPEPLAVAEQRVAVNICYEDAFGEEIIRQLPQATLLANVSNVAWFGDSLAPEQHLQISRMRALETGRTMLRATNTGVTAIVDPHGHVAGRLPQFTEGVLEGTVQGYTGATPYTRLRQRSRACARRQRIACIARRHARRAPPAYICAQRKPVKFAPRIAWRACKPSRTSSSRCRTSGPEQAACCFSLTTWKSARARSIPRPSCARSAPSPGTRPTCSPRAAPRTAATATTPTGCSTTISFRWC